MVIGAEPTPGPPKQTVARARTETAEERKARKQQVRNERQVRPSAADDLTVGILKGGQERRQEKKATKTTFTDERKRQQKRAERQLAVAAADVGHPVNASGATVSKLS
jgi:hypothetical protein